MKLTNRQKENLAKTFFDFSKLIFVAVVSGQFLPQIRFNWAILIGGLILCIIFVLAGTILDKGANK